MATEPVAPKQSNISSRHEAVYKEFTEPQVQPAIQPPPVSPPPAIPVPPVVQKEEKAVETLPANTGEKAGEQPPQLIFGKYKTIEEAEKGYKEAERSYHQKSQEVSQYAKQVEFLKQHVDLAKLAQSQTQQQVEQVAQQQPDYLDQLVSDPEGFKNRLTTEIAGRVQQFLSVQELTSNWKRENADLVPHEHLVNAELVRLSHQNSEGLDSPALLAKATENIRTIFNLVRAEGKLESTQIQSEARGSALSQVPQSSERGASNLPPAPASPDSYDSYMAERKEQIARKMGSAIPGTGPLRPAFR